THRDLVTAKAVGSLTVPALVALLQAGPHLLTQTKLCGQLVGSQVMVLGQRSERTPTVGQELDAGARPLPHRRARTPDVLDQERSGRPCLAEVIAVVRVPLGGQIVSEPLSLLVRVSVAAHPREQARVVHDASFSIVYGHALSQPQGDQARPDHVLHRLPETQVGPQRQQGDKLSAANPRASLRPGGTSL